MSTMTDDEIKVRCERLLSLLLNPQHGLTTWVEVRRQRAAELRDALNEMLGYPPPPLQLVASDAWGVRRRLPDERPALTHKFSVGGQEGYLTAGNYEDGTLGEIFLKMSRPGAMDQHALASMIAGLMDCFATAVSLALQFGVPLAVLAEKFKHTKFEPAGPTGNKALPRASSLMDYLFRWLSMKYLPSETAAA